MTTSSFFDRRLFLNLGLTLLSSSIILVCIKLTPSIHLPYFVATALATGLGFLESRRGWFLAVVQVIIIWLGYMLIVPTPDGPADRDIENFGLYGSMILTFIGSFIGGLLKRALDRG
ncbi:hypothetical protein [Spirosoma fluviale]|uniref:Uncharacterized protein n=1 Tax=Spirosoma fluviale TaxID=1597977 RepID=A0A286G0K3_9BACT|nr:hypothetical protein [Spirosoma fluviale]SOD89077.1 hypothetical protein SAMN06269250_2942 [Spirosoma fluviale]